MNMITGECDKCKRNVVRLGVKYQIWTLVIADFDADSVSSISRVDVNSNKKAH